MGATFPPVSQNEVRPKKRLLTSNHSSDRINHSCTFYYNISDQWTAHTHTHTHTHTYSHSVLCRLNQRSLTRSDAARQKQQVTDDAKDSVDVFTPGTFSSPLTDRFVPTFFPLLCKVSVVTRSPAQTPLTVQENFSTHGNFCDPAKGNLKIDDATNHSSHETR